MRLNRHIFLPLILIAVAFSACTRNNGDIGDYFGEWRLDAMTADDHDVALYGSDAVPDPEFGTALVYTFAFQSNIVRINSIYDHHDMVVAIGSWIDRGSDIEFNFTHSDDSGDAYGYSPSAVLQIPTDRVITFGVYSPDDGKMVLTQTAADGTVYKYYLTKQH